MQKVTKKQSKDFLEGFEIGKRFRGATITRAVELARERWEIEAIEGRKSTEAYIRRMQQKNESVLSLHQEFIDLLNRELNGSDLMRRQLYTGAMWVGFALGMTLAL